jgi:hypothetical protein
VAKAGCARPLTIPPFIPMDFGDISHKGGEVWGALICRFLKAQGKKHAWVGVNGFWSFGCLKSPQWTLGRLKWISGTQDWQGGAFAYHKEYAKPRCCDVCKNFHPLDFLSVLALCPSFAPHLDGFFELFQEAAPLVRQWWGNASSSEKRLFVRTLIPRSLADLLLESLARNRLKEIMGYRHKAWPKVRQELLENFLETPPPAPTGVKGAGHSAKRGWEDSSSMRLPVAVQNFRKRMAQWVDDIWDPPSRGRGRGGPRGRGRGTLSLSV